MRTGVDRCAQEWTDARKGRYDGEYTKVDMMAVWGTADREVYPERLILKIVKQLISFENQNTGLGW